MKRQLVLRATAVILLFGSAVVAFGGESCTGWMQQPDGSSWRTCVDDNGTQYCEESRNGVISRVSCR